MTSDDKTKVDRAGISQEMLDRAIGDFKKSWGDALAVSGLSQTMFIVKGGISTRMLAEYQEIKDHVESEGTLIMPEFIPGVTVKIS